MKPLVAAVAVLATLVVCVPVQAQVPVLSLGPEVDALRARAEQGDAEAQVSLGDMYADGLRLPEDEAEAVHWYRLAAQWNGTRREAPLLP